MKQVFQKVFTRPVTGGWVQHVSEPLEDKTRDTDLASQAVAIACAHVHSLVLLESGECWAWGDTEYGELGNGTTTAQRRPVKVDLASKAVTVGCGVAHSLVLLESGECWAWGHNEYGQLEAKYAEVQAALQAKDADLKVAVNEAKRMKDEELQAALRTKDAELEAAANEG